VLRIYNRGHHFEKRETLLGFIVFALVLSHYKRKTSLINTILETSLLLQIEDLGFVWSSCCCYLRSQGAAVGHEPLGRKHVSAQQGLPAPQKIAVFAALFNHHVSVYLALFALLKGELGPFSDFATKLPETHYQ